MKIYTIGHSNRSINEFIQLLNIFNIKKLVDVRSIPKSKHNPQFNQDELKKSLRENKIKYKYIDGLGGFRPVANNEINAGWINKSFKSYADYMQTVDFKKNLDKLIEIAKKEQIVIMCAEILHWRCHRSLIGDALTIRGIQVEDIISEKSPNIHKIKPWAKVEGFNITYPAQEKISHDLTEKILLLRMSHYCKL